MKMHATLFLPALALTMFLLAGCTPEKKPAAGGGSADAGHDDHGHGAHEKGPHDGEVFELGKGDYHVELVETSDSVLTVYILDGELVNEVPVGETGVVLNLMVEGEPRQHELKAVQAKEGMASQFNLDDAAVAKAVHDPKSKAKLMVDIAGNPYNADLAHDHDHGHAHGEHEGHDDHAEGEEHHEDDTE